jgi:hypothetical protein
MYPNPVGGQPPVSQQPPQPVLTAVKLMYVGAGLEVVGLILNLASGEANIAYSVVIPLIGAGIWIWMAISNKAGKNWARITSTVFFSLDCLVLLLVLIGIGALLSLTNGAATGLLVLGVVFAVITWLVGLFAVILIWRRESSAYFAAMSSSAY